MRSGHPERTPAKSAPCQKAAAPFPILAPAKGVASQLPVGRWPRMKEGKTAMSFAIEEIAIGDLTPWAKNARTHSMKQLRQIGESIRTFGFTNPVLIDASNTILAGHGRVAAAKLIGMTHVPCVRLEHMSQAQKRAYVLADNKLACLTSAPMGQFRVI